MRLLLQPHPDFPAKAVRSIEVSAIRQADDRLSLRFHVTGAIEDVLWPAPTEAGRSDGLWRHSCFEAFIRAGEGPDYREINVAPSHRWASYAFDSYRAGMRDASEVEVQSIAWTASDTSAELAASARLGGVPETWRLGLSAIIEERSGAKSYWALRHPPGKPDFHQADCFTAILAAPSVP